MTKKLAIIGLGPGGLGSLKVLLDSLDGPESRLRDNIHIDVFEALSDIGGLWNYNASISPKAPHATMYDNLETNLHKKLMQYTDFDFKNVKGNFPTRFEVLEYLQSYYKEKILAKHAQKFEVGIVTLHFDSKIIAIERNEEENTWSLTSGKGKQFAEYDDLIVSTGHFKQPYLPKKIPGYEDWDKHLPNSLLHSKNYQNPKLFKDKTVVVVGGSSSGSDILIQITSTAKVPVIWSVYNPEKNNFPVNPDFTKKDVGVITNLDYQTRSATFANGETVKDIDYILFATGFKYDFNEFKPNALPPSFKLEKEGKVIKGLYKHLVVADNPTVFFTVLPKNIIPFKLAEVQTSFIIAVIEGRIPQELIKADDETSLEESLHAFETPANMEYSNSLYDLVKKYYPALFQSFRPTYWENDIYDHRFRAVAEKFARQETLNKLAVDSRANNTSYVIPF